MRTIYGSVGFIMKTLGLSYKEICWGVNWGVLLRMMVDQPRQVKKKDTGAAKSDKDPVKLTAQTADEFDAFIRNVNKNKNSRK